MSSRMIGVDVGGTFQNLTLRNQPVLLAGNEQPWFPWQAQADLPARSPEQLRILMSHSPDQISWARAREFDLMLAGHNHGGQVRIPVIGPIATPSWYGTRYACGLFDAPPARSPTADGQAAPLSARTSRCGRY